MPATTTFTCEVLRRIYVLGAPTILDQLIKSHIDHAVSIVGLSKTMKLILTAGTDVDAPLYNDAQLVNTYVPAIATAGFLEAKELGTVRLSFLDPAAYTSAETRFRNQFWTAYLSTSTTSVQSLVDLASYFQSDITADVTGYDPVDVSTHQGWFGYSSYQIDFVVEVVSAIIKTMEDVIASWQVLDNQISNLDSTFPLRARLAILQSALATSVSDAGAVVTDLKSLQTSLSTQTPISEEQLSTLAYDFGTLSTVLSAVDDAVKKIYYGDDTNSLIHS